MLLAPNSKLIFIGDSITDCGRDPSGEVTPWNLNAGLGRGYVNLVHGWLTAGLPGHRIRVINRGISGNTVLDLQARWPTDVLALQPDWLAIMIGVNDVWRQFDVPLRSDLHVDRQRYARTYHDLLEVTRPKVKGLVLLSPFVVDPNRADPMRATMDAYGEIVRGLARDFGAIFVDVQAELDRLMTQVPPTALAWDRIHLDVVGHTVLARAFLTAVGFPWR
jgi:lysophospholipase L1-like esterase